MLPSFTTYEAVTSPWTLFVVVYTAILTLRAMKRQSLLPNLHCICLVPRLVYRIMNLNIVSANLFVSLGKMIGMMRLRTCRKDEVILCRARIGHTHSTHLCILRKDPPPHCEHCQCILTVRHILVECNNFHQEIKVYLVEEMWWNHLDSIHSSLHCIL